MHEISLITTIAFGLTAALIFGLLAKRLGLSPIVGYLLAGIVIGPYTPGFVGDAHIASQLAEIGVILLMFGVGLHFHLKDLLAVRSIAIPGAIGQSLAAAIVCMGLALFCGMGWKSGLVLGIATAVASTVVLLRVLMDHGLVDTPQGHVAVGWLIVEDIITVLALVLLPLLAMEGNGPGDIAKIAGVTVLKLVILVLIFAYAGTRLIPHLLLRVAGLRSRELFTLTVLVMSISVATIAYLIFGASMALGAFLAGMVVGQSQVSHQAASDALPLRDAFAVLFFVSVGMLFDYTTIWKAPGLMFGVLAVILVVKPVVALLIVLISGHSLKTGLTVAGGLAQIGEFSFIISEVGKSLGILSGEGNHVLVAAAIISISLNPWLFKRILALEPLLSRQPLIASWLSRHEEKRAASLLRPIQMSTEDNAAQHVNAIVVGYGPVGSAVSRLLSENGVEPLIVEMNVDTVQRLQAEGKNAIYGDASRHDILKAAGIDHVAYLIITLPSTESSLAIIHAARGVNESVRILARARYLNQKDIFEQAGASVVCYEEAEVGIALSERFLQEVKMPKKQLNQEVSRIQREFRPE